MGVGWCVNDGLVLSSLEWVLCRGWKLLLCQGLLGCSVQEDHCMGGNDLANVRNRSCHHRCGCHSDGVIVVAERVRGSRDNKAFAHSVNVFKELVDVVAWWW